MSMDGELQKKIERAVRLIQSAGRNGQIVEVAYSGGKDSDVILELSRISGIKYRAIYKNTTIDPPGTIKHVLSKGVEILRPEKTFFQLIESKGYPSRFRRFCCRYLKEYKVLDRVIIGVRRAESSKRAKRYSEPTECRFYGSKKEHAEAFYPILDWTSQDVVDFIKARDIDIHPLYYREDGSIDPSRRLGCMCCPLSSVKKRLAEFKRHPNMVKAYLRAGKKFRDDHPDATAVKNCPTVYHQFVAECFFDSWKRYKYFDTNLFGSPDYKKLIEDYFHVNLETRD